jgi:hypothetical protein
VPESLLDISDGLVLRGTRRTQHFKEGSRIRAFPEKPHNAFSEDSGALPDSTGLSLFVFRAKMSAITSGGSSRAHFLLLMAGLLP